MKFVSIMFKSSVHTAKEIYPVAITEIKWLMLFREIISVYFENHTKPMNRPHFMGKIKLLNVKVCGAYSIVTIRP
jgi:hypothetical protein